MLWRSSCAQSRPLQTGSLRNSHPHFPRTLSLSTALVLTLCAQCHFNSRSVPSCVNHPSFWGLTSPSCPAVAVTQAQSPPSAVGCILETNSRQTGRDPGTPGLRFMTYPSDARSPGSSSQQALHASRLCTLTLPVYLPPPPLLRSPCLHSHLLVPQFHGLRPRGSVYRVPLTDRLMTAATGSATGIPTLLPSPPQSPRPIQRRFYPSYEGKNLWEKSTCRAFSRIRLPATVHFVSCVADLGPFIPFRGIPYKPSVTHVARALGGRRKRPPWQWARWRI
jgi:hypothetical protein